MNISNKKFHFIAIGGVGMSALAKYLAERGANVTGSDISESKYTHLLEDIGVKVSIGHDENLIENDMIVVASTAIKNDNPEIKRAKELGLKIYHRSDILKMISNEFSENKDSYFIGFSGTHGKTTTSGLCAYLLEKGGFEPSFVVGGIIPELNTNGKYSKNIYFSAELDESDGTIEKYTTDIAVINNIEEDHLDFYKNGFTDIADTFKKYLLNNQNQKILINTDNEGCRRFIEMNGNLNFITFGLNNADYTAENIKQINLTSSFELYKKGTFITEINLSIPGIHNVYNALAVCAAIIEAGIDINKVKYHFKTFTGMGRRFQKVSEFNGIQIFDDYAHHPSEIKTTLKSTKEAVKENKRVVAIFQPHRYTRLNSLWNDFKKSFDYADIIFVTDVYSAGESEIENVSSYNFVKEISHKKAEYISGDIKSVAEKIYPYLKKDDIVITLGAGSITKLGSFLTEIDKRN